MINLWHLIHERRDIIHEFFKIAVHNDIQIDSVFSACKESLPVAPSVRKKKKRKKKKIQYNLSCCIGKYLPVQILLHDFHYKGPRVNRLQIPSRHLQYQTHGTGHSDDNPGPPFHLSGTPERRNFLWRA